MNAIRHIRTLPLFHRAVLLDLATGIPTAAVLLAGADALAPLLGLPATLLRGAGLVLLPFLLLLVATLRQARPHKFAAWSIIEINLFWVLGSFWLLLAGGYAPTATGSAVVVVQALAVLVLAALQFAGWRRLSGGAVYEPAATRA
jgi:hypothetical protein